jgi:hypothetical protein
MCRGRPLRVAEIREAAKLRSFGLEWRYIGRLLKRNHSALFKAVKRSEGLIHSDIAPTLANGIYSDR